MGLTSMRVTFSRSTVLVSPATRAVTASSRMLAVLVHGHVGLGDDVLVLFPGGEVEGVHLELGGALAGLLQLLVLGFQLGQGTTCW